MASKRKVTRVLKGRGKLTKIDKPINDVLITQLTPELLGSTWLRSVTIAGDGETELDNSWTDLILSLMGMLWNARPQHFVRDLTKYGVISDGIDVSRDIVTYTQSSDIEYEVYKLNRVSGYYVEFRRNYSDYIQAIKGLLLSLHIPFTGIKFNIKPIKTIENQTNHIDIKLNNNYSDVEQIQESKTIAELVEKNKSDFDIISISIFGNEQSVKSIQQALYIYIMWAKAVYGEGVIESGIHNSTAEVGITTPALIDNYDTRFETYKLENNYVYCTNNNKAIIQFIYETAIQVGISPGLISIQYKTLKIS